ncbi:MAG: rod shape-determining protein MreC [Erysipelothrix sp.]|nr:rod shape-determining protein MreC [Erysipelothrix sp.]
MKEKKPMRRFLSVMIAVLIISLFSLNLIKNLTVYQKTENNVYGFFSMVRYSLIDYPVKTFSNFTKDYAGFWQNRSVNDDLRQELEDAANWQMKEIEYKQEIESLKALNNLDSVYTDLDFISGRVLNRSFDSWNKAITINIGKDKGVVVGDAVMSARGLIGKVVSVTKNTSVVSLLTSNSEFTKVSVSIQTEDKLVNGIVHSYDTEKNVFNIQLMETEKSLAPGQKVVTSGLGGNFPKGLYLGEVKSIETVPTGIGVDISAVSEVNFQGIDYIKVVKQK